jgi:acyl dehydratase
VESRYAHAVGRKGAVARLDIERGHVLRFAEATLDDDPVYRDLDAARAAGHPAIPAPPTFAIALRAPDPRVGLDIDWTKLLNGEQTLTYSRPLYVGDAVDVQQRIVEAYVKEGKAGAMDMMVLETTGHVDGVLVFTSRSLIVIRR